jgi:hypothetical protein
VPRPNPFKIGVAIAAAAVGAILAISTVFAHSTPTTSGHSVAGSIVKAAHAASFPVFANDPVPNAVTSAAELKAEAAEAAVEQAALAAKLAALKAAAAADPCVAADLTEDVAEKAADKLEDAAEKANPALETPDEDAKEKAASQAAEKAEAPEVKCAGAAAVKTFASSAHHVEGKHDH